MLWELKNLPNRKFIPCISLKYMNIALVSYRKEEKFSQVVTDDEDDDLLAYLIANGINIEIAIWNDQNIEWTQFDLLIIKSPWDYHNHLNKFLQWLDEMQAAGIKVLNTVEVIKWNSNKKYLKEITEFGLPVIASEYLLKGSLVDEQLFDLFNTHKLVIKPCVSAGAQNTVLIDKKDFAENTLRLNQLLKNEDFIVQPFVKEIQEGEWSFLFFNGNYSHCVLKTPKLDDFRVQHDHGGQVSYPEANREYMEQAKMYLNILPEIPLYARVDGVIIQNHFHLMELELIEPYLFFNGNKSLLNNYYQALLAKLNASR